MGRTIPQCLSDNMREILTMMSEKSSVATSLSQLGFVPTDKPYIPIYLDVCLKTPGNISFLRTDRVVRIKGEPERWTTPLRQSSRPSRVVKELLGDINDRDLEQFTVLYRSMTSPPEHTFRTCVGDELARYYLMDNYRELSGELAKSCLRYSHVNHHLELIKDNPDRVRSLVMVDGDDKVLGRALVWDTDQGIRVMDKIYTISNPSISELFKKWATDNNCLIKTHQSAKKPLYFIKDGENVRLDLSVTIKSMDYEHFPFLDTFKFADTETNTLYNHIPEHFTQDERYKAFTRDSGVSICGLSLDFDELDGQVCNTQEMHIIDGLKVGKHNYRYSSTYRNHLLLKDCVWSDEHEDYIYADVGKNDPELLMERYENILRDRKRELYGPYDMTYGPKFHYKGVTFSYDIKRTFMMVTSGGFSNRTMFSHIGIDVHRTFNEAYGYEPGRGCFPSFRANDMNAVNRLIATTRQMIIYKEGWKPDTPLPLFKDGQIHHCVFKYGAILVYQDSELLCDLTGQVGFDTDRSAHETAIELIDLNRKKENLTPIRDLFLTQEETTEIYTSTATQDKEGMGLLYDLTRGVQNLGYETLDDFLISLNRDNIDILDNIINRYYEHEEDV